MSTEAELAAYPHSDPRGIPLPFDVGDPQGLYITAVAVAAGAVKTLSDTWDIVVLYADVDTIVQFGNEAVPSVALDAEQDDTQFVPANTPVSIRLPSLSFATISANGASVGTLKIQKYRKWQAASQQVQQANL